MEPVEEMISWTTSWTSAGQGCPADGRDAEYKGSGTETGQREGCSVEYVEPGEMLQHSVEQLFGWGEGSAEKGACPACFSGAEGEQALRRVVGSSGVVRDRL